jgi:putative membrane protein
VATSAGMVAAPAAWAHDGGHHAGHLGLTLDPHLLLSLVLIGGLYARGVSVLWRRAGIGRGVSHWQAAAFAGGWLALVVALVSPLDGLAEELASAHMVQHLLLMLVAAPLLVLGAPAFAMLWALPARWRAVVATRWRRAHGVRGTWEAVSQPLVAWVFYFVVLWGWHLPALYEAALRNPLLHDVQHVLFVVAAGMLWWMVMSPVGRPRLSGGAGVISLFTTSMHAMALGVFMTLSPRGWYAEYSATTQAWGLSLLEDQQIAGAIMWMPAAIVYVVLAASIFAYWLRQTESATERLERVAAAGRDERERALERHLAWAEIQEEAS